MAHPGCIMSGMTRPAALWTRLRRRFVEFLLPTRRCNRCLVPMEDDPAAKFPRFCEGCLAYLASPGLSAGEMAVVDAILDSSLHYDGPFDDRGF